jgi:hypothetical protein
LEEIFLKFYSADGHQANAQHKEQAS